MFENGGQIYIRLLAHAQESPHQNGHLPALEQMLQLDSM